MNILSGIKGWEKKKGGGRGVGGGGGVGGWGRGVKEERGDSGIGGGGGRGGGEGGVTVRVIASVVWCNSTINDRQGHRSL